MLTAFCTELTGITQSMWVPRPTSSCMRVCVRCVPGDFQVTVDAVRCRVDAAPMLSTIVAEHSGWMREIGVLEAGASFAAVTWSDWDLKVCGCRCLRCSLLRDNAIRQET